MSLNQSALDALAQEGIPMSEVQLLTETQKVRSNGNGSTPAQTNGQVAYHNGIGRTTATGNTKPGSGPTHVGEARSLPAEIAFPEPTDESQLVTRRGRQRTPEPWTMSLLCR